MGKYSIKVILFLSLVLFSSCDIATSNCFDILIDSYFKNRYSNKNLYNWGIPKMDSFEEIAVYVESVLTYTNVDREYLDTHDMKSLYENGIGDCEVYSLIFKNVAHFSMGVETGIALSDPTGSNQRVIGGGGIKTIHSVIYYNGEIYSPYTGRIITDYGIMYYFMLYK